MKKSNQPVDDSHPVSLIEYLEIATQLHDVHEAEAFPLRGAAAIMHLCAYRDSNLKRKRTRRSSFSSDRHEWCARIVPTLFGSVNSAGCKGSNNQ